MNRLSNQLLSRSGFAGDQNSGITRRDLLHAVQNLADGVRFSNDVFKLESGLDLFTEIDVLTLQFSQLFLGLLSIIDAVHNNGLELLFGGLGLRYR